MNKTALYIIIGWLLLSFAVQAQTDTVVVNRSFKASRINNHLTYFRTGSMMQPDSAWLMFKNHDSKLRRADKIHFGPVNEYFWFSVAIRNESSSEAALWLEIPQPHIYNLVFFQVIGDSVSRLYDTGIHFDFYSRPVESRFYDFPLRCRPGEVITLLLMVHHINSLSIPVDLGTQDYLRQRHERDHLLWGAWIGYLSFSTLFALIGFLLLRNRVFLWYFLYVLSAAFFGFTEQGFAFQYLFPMKADTDAPAIIQTAFITLIMFIKLSQELLATKKNMKKVHQWLNGVFWFITLMIAGSYIFTPDQLVEMSPYLLPPLNITLVLGLVLMAYAGLKTLNTNRQMAIFYLVAYGTVISAGIFNVAIYGFGWFQYVGPNPVLMAYLFESTVLSLALVIQYRRTLKERADLLVKVATQQKDVYKSYLEGIEKERTRIAGELHDDIGSRLSHLQRLLFAHSEQSQKTGEQFDQIIKDVRQLSHELAPPLAHISGLVPLILQLIKETSETTGTDIKLQQHGFTDELKAEQVRQVYRIVQEAFNNVIKHAKATKVDVQLFGHDNEWSLTIDDNGLGFDIEKVSGHGLEQMKIRTEALGGKIEIQSRPGKGTQLLLVIPYRKAMVGTPHQ